jgi:hypothetical protein
MNLLILLTCNASNWLQNFQLGFRSILSPTSMSIIAPILSRAVSQY